MDGRVIDGRVGRCQVEGRTTGRLSGRDDAGPGGGSVVVVVVVVVLDSGDETGAGAGAGGTGTGAGTTAVIAAGMTGDIGVTPRA
jgi:hypothetical protein